MRHVISHLLVWCFAAFLCRAVAAEPVVENGRLRVRFGPASQGFPVVSFYDKARGIEWARQGGSPTPLWEMVLGNRRLQETLLAGTAPCERSFTAGEGTVALSFKGLSVGEEKNALDLTCTLRLDGERSEWRFSVANRSKEHAVWEVRCPRISFGPPNAGTEDDVLAVPLLDGMAYPDPMNTEFGWTGMTTVVPPAAPQGYCTDFGRSRTGILYGVYPTGHQSMQFWAYYDPTGGLYCAAEDGAAQVKDFRVERHRSEQRYVLEVNHFPAEMMGVHDYAPAYPVVLQPFGGDWYDACRIYRAWAGRQSWCAASRKKAGALPEWFRDLGLVSQVSGPDHESSQRHLLSYAAQFQGAQLVFLTEWFEGAFDSCPFPVYKETGVPGLEQFYGLAARGIVMNPNFDGHLWGQEDPAAPAAGYESARTTPAADPYLEMMATAAEARRRAGVIPAWAQPAPGRSGYLLPCPASEGYRAFFGAVARKHIRRFGGKSIYLDEFAQGADPFCFNAKHGHSLGGGDWLTRGKLAMLDELRKEAPDLVITGEGLAESLVGRVDAFLTLPVRIHQHWSVPMFQTVYQEYADTYAAYVFPPDLSENDGLGFRTKLALQAAAGEIPGHMATWRTQLLLADDAKYQRDFRWLQDLVAFRHAHREFFSMGQRLREPKGEGVATLEVPWALGKGKEAGFCRKQMPAVVTSAWRAPDGRVGVALVNPTTTEQTATLRLDAQECGLDASKALLRESVPAGALKMVEIRKEREQ